MRMFVFLIAAIFAMSFSFYSSASGSRGPSIASPQATSSQTNPAPRCAKKMLQATNNGCLILKRKSRTA